MTKAERAELRKIIGMLFADEDGNDRYTEGMTRLCRLARMSWPAGEAYMEGGGETITIEELSARAAAQEREHG